MTDYVTILTIVVGDGALIAIVTLLFNYFVQKSEARLEARKDAREFYMTLFGKIVYIEDLLNAYLQPKEPSSVMPSSVIVSNVIPGGKVFIREKGYVELSPEQIKSHFGEAYKDFLTYYTKKRCDGYGIFVSKKLRDRLLAFQSILTLDDTIDENKLTTAHKVARQIRENMEKLYGLK